MMLALLLFAQAAATAPAATPTPGTVVVRLADANADDDVDDGAFVDAVARALGDRQFVELPEAGPSRYLAEVQVDRHARGAALAPVGGSHVVAGGTAVVVPLATKKQRVSELVETTLTVRLRFRADGREVWEGSALTIQVDGTRAGDPRTLARKLAPAVVARFPAPATGPVSVP